MTVSKRLADFKATPAAQLTLREFHAQADSTEEQDPPSFQRVKGGRRSKKGRGRVYLLPKRSPNGPSIMFTSTWCSSTNGNCTSTARARARGSTAPHNPDLSHLTEGRSNLSQRRARCMMK